MKWQQIDELTKTELSSELSMTLRAAKLKQAQLYSEELDTIELLIKELRALAEQNGNEEDRPDELIKLSRAAVEIARALQKPL